MTQAEFAGTDLNTDLLSLLAELRRLDPALTAVFERHLPLLVDLRTSEQRKSGRAAFNRAVRADLLAMAEPA